MNCGHVDADAGTSDEETFRRLYGEGYFKGEEHRDYPSERSVIQSNFRCRLKEMEPYLKPERHQMLFEIGCAYGFFLDLARHRFAEAFGIDLAEEAVDFARSQLHVNAIAGDFLKYDFSGRKPDVVCLWDTIEHLLHPQRYLEKVSRHMNAGGLLFLTTADVESWVARIRREKWRMVHPPAHLHYFSKRTIRKLLGNWGFKVISNSYCGYTRSLDFMFYSIFVLRQHRPNWFKFMKKTGLNHFQVYLNLYDIMFVVAEKTS